MQKNRKIRPAVSSIIAGTLIASTVLASALSAQARPPRPDRPERQTRDSVRAAMRDSLMSRQGAMRPGLRRAPDAGVQPGAPGNPGGRGAPGMPGMQGTGMPGRGMQRSRMQGPGMQGIAPGARGGSPVSALLRARASLDLTDDQVRRLQAIESSAAGAPNSAEMLRARADLMEAMRGDGNLDAARAAMDRMNRLRTEQALSGLKARQEARNVLTPEQRTRAENLMGGAMRGARRNAVGNARGLDRGAARGIARGGARGIARRDALGADRRMQLRNRELVRRGAVLRQAPGARMRLRDPDARPTPGMRGGFGGGNVRPQVVQPRLRRDVRPDVRPELRPDVMRRFPPGVQPDRMMVRVPLRERDPRLEPRARRDR
jgi:hypothetical protein